MWKHLLKNVNERRKILDEITIQGAFSKRVEILCVSKNLFTELFTKYIKTHSVFN